MIGRYTENVETRLLGIDEVCPNVKGYSRFAEYMDRYLDSKVFLYYDTYKHFLKKMWHLSELKRSNGF